MRQVLVHVIPFTFLATLSLSACAHSAMQNTNVPDTEKVTRGDAFVPIGIVSTDAAPRLAGQSQAVIAGGFLFASAQFPLEPKSGEVVGGTTERATERVLDNLEAVLRAAGLTFADVVKTTVFLTAEREFDEMNLVYRRRFGSHLPARSTVVVESPVCDCILEIEMIAKTRDAQGPPATNR